MMVFYSPPLLFGEAIVVRWRPFFFHGLVARARERF